jgi:hypothetical protein
MTPGAEPACHPVSAHGTAPAITPGASAKKAALPSAAPVFTPPWAPVRE